MRIAVLTLAAGLALATPIVAQQMKMAKPGSRNPALVTAGSYIADSGHTLVQWEVDHMGFTPYFGMFGDVSGTLQFDPKQPSAAKVDIIIPVVKITTANAALTKHLLSKDFFGEAAADAHFISTSVVATGQKAKITGNLMLNGVTKPVTLDAEFYGAGKTPPQMGGKEGLGFTAKSMIKRSDFNLGYGVPIVSDEVKLTIAAGFMKD